MDLTIALVNYNTAHHLKKCLDSIAESKTSYKYQIYVIDNNSSDNSIDVAKQYKNINLIQNKDNPGMAASLNHVLKTTNSEYYLFLHPDTEIERNTIQTMIDFLHKYPTIAIAGPKLIYPNNKIFLSCHKFPTITNLIKEKLGLNGVYMRKANHTKIQEVDIIASACMFIRKTAINNQLFDDKFTNWCAEWDLAYQLKQEKRKIVYAPITTVIHYEAMSETDLEYKKHSYPIAEIMLERLLLFYKKHYSSLATIQLKFLTITTLILQSIRHPTRTKHYFKAIKKAITY